MSRRFSGCRPYYSEQCGSDQPTGISARFSVGAKWVNVHRTKVWEGLGWTPFHHLMLSSIDQLGLQKSCRCNLEP